MEVYKWMEEIRIVCGYNRSCIYDLPRFDYQFVPNETIELIRKFDGKPVDAASSFNYVENDWFDEFLLNEYVFPINKDLYECFVPLRMDWDHPSQIVNAIISDNYLKKSIDILDDLLCKQILISCNQLDRVKKILLEYFSITNFQRVNFLVPESFDDDLLIGLKEKFPVLGLILLPPHIADETIKKVATLESNPFLNIGIEIFTESQKHHVYFNRKLYIGPNGEIKNAPECEEVFGNIKDITTPEELKQIIDTPDFQNYWFAHKEVTDVCKDCEFRHMCVDNRLPHKRNRNEWYHKKECNYNPYICKWQGEDGYQTLSACGVISNEKGFSIDHERIAKINEALWGEE